MTHQIRRRKYAFPAVRAACAAVGFLFLFSALCPGLAARAVSAGEKPMQLAAKKNDPPERHLAAYEKNLQETMNHVFRVLWSIYRDKGLTEQEKKQKILAFLRHFRFGPKNKDYIWVNDLQGKVLMDPYIPELEGKDLRGYQDADGRQVFAEFRNICLNKGQGFATYLWPMYDSKIPTTKVSLVRVFKPWGWIVGCGFYIKTIEGWEPPEPRFYTPLDRPDDHEPASPV